MCVCVLRERERERERESLSKTTIKEILFEFSACSRSDLVGEITLKQKFLSESVGVASYIITNSNCIESIINRKTLTLQSLSDIDIGILVLF